MTTATMERPAVQAAGANGSKKTELTAGLPPLWGDIPIPIIMGCGEFGQGKAQPLNAKVLTPAGWKTMGEIRPGDEVTNPATGLPCRVLGVFPQGEKEVYRVAFSDGSSAECCDEHLWLVQDINHRNRNQCGIVLPLSEIRSRLALGRRLFIPLTEPVQFESETDLEVDPYLLGALLGDGGLTTNVIFTTADKELIGLVSDLLPVGMEARLKSGSNIDYQISGGRRGGNDRDKNPLLRSLRKIGVHGKRSFEKTIPDEYLRSSPWNRLAILQGLCDTDGSAAAGNCEYSTSSPYLRDQVVELVQSLGGTATVAERTTSFTHLGESRTGRLSYRLHIKLPDGMNPFRLSRKAVIYERDHQRGPTRKIVSAELVGRTACQCILLDSDEHLYVTDSYVVTHNTLFGLTICPGPETLCYDNEGSSLTYRSLDFDHVDMASELSVQHPNGYTAIDRFLWWKKDAIARGKSGGRKGRYRVLMVDPVSELEDGLADYIKANLPLYGLTSAQVQKSSGLFWGVMKREWKALLDQLRASYETVYGVVHMRDEFVGNAPSGKREPKGKETLFELASLFLEFERVKDNQGNVSAVPSAKVLKHRLMRPVITDGEMEIIPILPPRLPRATPKAIRDYIAKPPDYSKLKKDERVVEKEFSDEEKLRLQAQIAADQAAASQADLSRLEKMQQAAMAQQARMQAAVPAPDAAGQHAARMQQQSHDSTGGLISAVKVNEIVEMFPRAFGVNKTALGAWLRPKLAEWGVEKIPQLSEAQAEQLQADLTAKISFDEALARGAELTAQQGPEAGNVRTQSSQSADQTAAGASTTEPPFDPSSGPAAETPQQSVVPAAVAELAEHIGGSLAAGPAVQSQKTQPAAPAQITLERIATIKSLFAPAFGDEATLKAEFPGMLATLGVSKVSELTCPKADALIGLLRIKAIAGNLPPAGTGHDAPGSINDSQLRQLAELSEKCGWTQDEQIAWLKPLGAANFKQISFNQAAGRINELIRIQQGFGGGVPGN